VVLAAILRADLAALHLGQQVRLAVALQARADVGDRIAAFLAER
jgi:hypothetical protein